MTARTSRKRNAPARLREESWYLVSYEDDFNLRVLHEDEVHHIFPEDNEDEPQVGDIVSALWLPNGQYYDAKVLQKGGDKEELMKERMRLEKAKKNGNQPERGAEKKRKHRDDSNAELQQREKSKKQDDNKENEQKAKEKEAKKKKKEEEKQRQDLLLQTRKSQAAARWASASPLTSSNHQMEEEVTILRGANPTPDAGFTPVPIRGRNSTAQARVSPPSEEQHERFDDTSLTPTGGQKSCSSLPPSKQKKGTPQLNSPHSASSNSPTLSIASTSKESIEPPEETPRRSSNKKKRDCDPRRGLHFQSSMLDLRDSSSEEEEDTECCAEDNPEVPHGNCCKEQQLENEALRKRIQKLHRRLNIALKAKTTEEIMNSRPSPGVLDPSLATEYKMVELVEGSGVFWYTQHRAYCSAVKNWSAYVNAVVDIFFHKETLAISCAMGNEKKSKTGDSRQPLNPLIIHAIIGKACSKFTKDGISASQVVQKINMKCVEARRPQRIRISSARVQ